MLIPFLLVAVGLLALASSGARASSSPNRFVPDLPVGLWVQRWRPYVTRVATELGIPVEFALAWIQIESGGNPCSIGETKNPPQEYGLFQLNYPYDEKYGTRQAMRAYCNNSAVRPVRGPKEDPEGWRRYRKELESQTRALTPAEEAFEVTAGLKLVQHCREFANKYMKAAGIQWNRQDSWTAVKLVHGLPTLVGLMPLVTKKLGHPPRNFAEYRKTVEAMTDAELNTVGKLSGYRSQFQRTFDNSERVGRKAA